MKWLSTKVTVLLLGSLLIVGCGGGGSNFSAPGEKEKAVSNNAANSIEFVSAMPQTIALKGTGGPPRSETSVLVFKVVDEYGNPVPSQTVKFELSTEIGGLFLSNSKAVSNSAGMVHVTVNAGNMPTHIRVHATLKNNPSITVVSNELAVTTGLPDQNSITLCAETPDSKTCRGEITELSLCDSVTIKFYAADHFNNFVPDGSVVVFTTEGGSIIGSSTITAGVCEVTWNFVNPIPPDGRVTILAFCIGEESFTDVNGNGYFDPEEEDWFDQSSDMAEPFRDDNENGERDPGEEYWDYNNNGEFDGVPNGKYNGSLCSDEAEELNLCTKELVYVQDTIYLIIDDECLDKALGEAGSIDFMSATPGTIALKGTGGPARSETSVLIFKVVDEYGNPLPNQAVNFELTSEVGGLSLSNPNDVSNSEGLVRVTVNAGNMSTHVRVRASLARNPSIRVVSDELLVSTGLPDQNSITLFSKFVEIEEEEWEYGKAELDIVFQAADHFNNFVPDGTVVYFTTEGGSIEPSATTEKGGCKVRWRSGNPLPDDDTITILAVCIGEESFFDLNGNGYFDPNDWFDERSDVGEPFRDDNENNKRDPEEEFWDYNGNGECDVRNGKYNGTLCSDEAEAMKSCTKELVYVQKSLQLMRVDVQKEWSAGNASSIDFISANPNNIALKNTGGPARSETSILVFKVVDEYGIPLQRQTVNFKLSTEIGGLSLSNQSAISDSEGLVRVTVNAGNVSTHVRVHASLADNPLISVVSDELVVSTGLPDQNSISIGADILNPEALDYVNVEVKIIFLAADLFNNFVPDGTRVYFTTEGGSIPASAIIKDGHCDYKGKDYVPWVSGNPRPTDDGRCTILAFCIGEESFNDVNGNGLYDPNDSFETDTDLAEPFRDDNEDGEYNPGEWYWDYNDNGKFDGVPDGKYNGSLCSDEAEEMNLCTKELVYVQASISLIMSGSFANITFDPDSVDLIGKFSETVTITIADDNNNPMPCNTEITVKTSNGKFADGSQSKGFIVPNTNRSGPGITEFTVILLPNDEDKTTFGILEAEVKTPFGHVYTHSITVVDED